MNLYVAQDSHTCFGAPRIRGTRVTTANIYDLYLGENHSVKKTAKWLGITEAQVRAAVRYEKGTKEKP